MTLVYAQRCADRLLDWLMPYCELVRVAGSIRRGRPEPNDIDLVAIPKIDFERDLLGQPVRTRNLAENAIRMRAGEEHWELGKCGPQYMVWVAKGVQVDLWFATPGTWGTLLLCRTGSKEHNIWLAQRAKVAGGHWNPHHGLTIHGGTVGAMEVDIYEALGLQYIEPENREAGKLPKEQQV